MRVAITSSRTIWMLCSATLAGLAASSAVAQQPPFLSQALTPAGEYTFGIEGPAVDSNGNLYVVNFGRQGTIGKLPAGASQSELFTTLAEGSVGNAIRFDRDGRMFVADYKKHSILRIGADGGIESYFHSDD